MRTIRLQSDVPYVAPRNRWTTPNHPLDSNQLNAELVEHKDAAVMLQRAFDEAMVLFDMVPDGYDADPVRYSLDQGVILVTLVARSE